MAFAMNVNRLNNRKKKMSRPSNLEKDTTVSLENLGNEIRRVSQLGKAINASPLTKKAVVILLHEMSRVKKSDIEIILHNLPLLEREYLK